MVAALSTLLVKFKSKEHNVPLLYTLLIMCICIGISDFIFQHQE